MQKLFFTAAIVLTASSAVACPDGQHEECAGPLLCVCVPNLVPPPPRPPLLGQDELSSRTKSLRDSVKQAGDQILTTAVKNVEEVSERLDAETRTAIGNALDSTEKATQDVIKNYVKAANDVVDAVIACERFSERSLKGFGDSLTKAEARVREGKVVDAVWHMGTDQLNVDNKNASKLMQENEIVRQAAQGVASVYGGPAGAAVFAAWYQYNLTNGNLQAAILAGVYTYAVGKGYTNVGSMPSGTIDEVGKKAAATAAIRGLAVAAAGGSQQDALNAAMQGGGSVIVQAGQAYVTKEYVDPARAKADVYCMNATKQSCNDVKQWASNAKSRLDEYKTVADDTRNTLTSKDGQWVISWDRKALLDKDSKSPGVVLTYIGDGSPYRRQMYQIAAISDPKNFPAVVEARSNWVTFRAPNGNAPYFNRIPPVSVSEPLTVGDRLQANTFVNVRPSVSREMWNSTIDIVQPGETIKIDEVNIQSTKAGTQEWLSFDRVD